MGHARLPNTLKSKGATNSILSGHEVFSKPGMLTYFSFIGSINKHPYSVLDPELGPWL